MLRLKSLGQSVIEAGEARVMPAAETVFATALYLVMEAGRPVGRDELTRLLWPDVTDSQAQHGLRQAVYRLRSFGAKIETERSSLLLSPEFCSTDYGELLAPQTPAALEALADQIGGSFLPAYRPQLSEAFSTWVDRQRDVVHSAVARTLMAGMQAKKRVSDWNGAERLAAKCLAIDPLNEEATLTLAEAAALGGSKMKALSILNHYLEDIGEGAGAIKLPAVILRRRISEAYQDNAFPIRDAPFVGREEEMAELTRALARAQAGRGSAYVITGEPGIGKTRLLSEFTRVAALQRLHIVRVGCQSHDVRRPLSVFVDLVPKLLALPGALGCSPESMQYLRRLVAHDPDDFRIRDQYEPSSTTYSDAREGILDVLDAVSTETCIVVEIEDAQWLDEYSVRLAEEFSNWLWSHRLLLVLTSRTNDLTREHISLITLRPLPTIAGGVVARALADSTMIGRDDFVDWCVSSSGGNPYYLIELLRDGRREQDSYLASASLTRLLQNRVQMLGVDAKGLLEVCCILGRHSTLSRLESCLGITRTNLLRALQELDAAGMIEVDGPRAMSRHDLLSSVVLSQMSSPVKTMLHRFAAEILEKESTTSQAVGLIWESAEHWLLAADAPRAVELLRRCGNYLLDVGMPEEAARVLERAQMLTTDAKNTYTIGAERARALMRAELFKETIELTEALIPLRQSISPQPWILDEVGLMRIQSLWRSGGSVRDLAWAYVPSLSVSSVSCDEVIAAAGWLMTAVDNLCEANLAHEIFDRVSRCLDSADVRTETRLVFEMVYHCTFGDRTLATGLADKLVEHSRSNVNAALAIKHICFASFVHQSHGAVDRSIALAKESYSLAERLRSTSALSSCAGTLGAIYLKEGDLKSAEMWLSRTQCVCGVSQNKVLDSNNLSYLCELEIRVGDPDAAEVYLARSVPILATAHSARGDTRGLALATQIALLRGDPLGREQIVAFREAYERSKHSCSQDFHVESLLLALESRGQGDDARDLMNDYLSKYRRDSGVLSQNLIVVVKRLSDRS